MEIREEDYRGLISEYGRVLYLCHRNADPDAVGSAFALREAFGGDIGAVEGVSRTAASLISATRADIEIDPSPGGYDLVVVVDTAVALQIGDFRLGDYAVVDHHRDRDLTQAALFYIQRPADSTAEIVWEILKRSGFQPTKDAALGLVVGIITDTGRFKHSHASSFRTVAEILERTDIEYADALEVLSRVPTETSRRIAALRAASRAEIEWTGDWVVVSSEVGAFEGSSAMTLIEIGADVALVGGDHGDVTRVSGRARRGAVLAGLDLAAIMGEVGRGRGGDGGGHPGAAALEAAGSPEDLLRECRRRVLEALKGRISPRAEVPQLSQMR
ncbi:DHH family phosphoesterase [Candidatus Methanocrinis natronophilus]|uniref:DHH family phosphoesterase n=1 Tax=Candidatus Methanocrinis natronophilus TaxID=3033396 RepID=A0ABT5X805_9EURY|nr:DHH family phosphoesterase [Candidatus Methanocrinis natronophilus]MDF0590813.1 DHH family phosphoesterase [Candidatus Methanocrinis natronophilus]